MRKKSMMAVICAVLLLSQLSCKSDPAEDGRDSWAVHDMNRPQPPVVTPARQPNQPPSNAIVLFDGSDLSQWVSEKDGTEVKWKLENGYMEVVKGAGNIRTKQAFGDCQLHLEWTSPAKTAETGQSLANSGVFLMSKYEVQILDSYSNRTYPDGQAAAIYGQYPPMFNVSRKPGQWQSYDIIFRRPKFDKGGRLISPARVTLLHNGVVVQDSVELYGATVHKKRAVYRPHSDKLPILLQDHGDSVRYRNIWLVELP